MAFAGEGVGAFLGDEARLRETVLVEPLLKFQQSPAHSTTPWATVPFPPWQGAIDGLALAAAA